MPIIQADMWQGRSLEQELELVKALTETTARIADCSADSVYVVISEVDKANWGAGGQLCSDKYPD